MAQHLNEGRNDNRGGHNKNKKTSTKMLFRVMIEPEIKQLVIDFIKKLHLELKK